MDQKVGGSSPSGRTTEEKPLKIFRIVSDKSEATKTRSSG
jgi:hypothetical protein